MKPGNPWTVLQPSSRMRRKRYNPTGISSDVVLTILPGMVGDVEDGAGIRYGGWCRLATVNLEIQMTIEGFK